MKFLSLNAARRLPLALTTVASIFATQISLADGVSRPDAHAPIGVMGDHTHAAGEWMFSYRYMQMSMDGNSDDGDSLSPEQIATSAPNRFFGAPMQPPTLRVVPTQMDMEMHMFGVMYAPTDRLTLMLMGNYTKKDMDHVTFRGPAGTERLGTFRTSTSGLGDTRLAGLISLGTSENAKTHLTVGLSLPTGDTDETDTVLAPTGMTPTLRLPYPMQLGSGSYDPILGVTHTRYYENWSWGAQWNSVFRIEDNDEGYRFGDEHKATAWAAYRVSPALSLSSRLVALDRGDVDGIDPLIRAPVQTADPDRQGATRLDVGLGLNWIGQEVLPGHRFAVEALFPIDQDLNGPQLETDWTVSVGWQYAF